jgi:hypothetical protein
MKLKLVRYLRSIWAGKTAAWNACAMGGYSGMLVVTVMENEGSRYAGKTS